MNDSGRFQGQYSYHDVAVDDDLEVDALAFIRDTGWRPQKSLEDGLREMAAAYDQRMRGDAATTSWNHY